MKAHDGLVAWIVAAWVGLTPSAAGAAGPETFRVGGFSAMAPSGAIAEWEPLTFKRIQAHTRYTLVVDLDGTTVLKADSRASASALVRKVNLSASDYPWMIWRWKVGNTLETGDERKRSGDDYAARIYLAFAEDAERLSFFERIQLAALTLFYGAPPPAATLAYVWGNQAPAGSVYPNPYTDRVQMIAVDSGPAHVNQWRTVRRNIVEDFRLAFGSAPPSLSAVAVMTDTDDTGQSATAWYGDIALTRSP